MANAEEHPDLKEALEALEKTAARQHQLLERIAGYAARREWGDLLAAIPDRQRLEHFGRKVYSQSDEDGIIEEIFRRIGMTPSAGIFVECGAAHGIENNSHYLLRQGYSGVWIEASPEIVERSRRTFKAYVHRKQLEVEQSRITAASIDEHLAAAAKGRAVALLSIDVDGNDYWVWQAIRSLSPASVVVEYNARCPPPLAQVQEYRPDRVWNGSDYFGASLAALTKLGESKGYRLVGCNITGVNAFFVRQDLVGDRFPYELTAEHLYQPPRYHLTYDCFRHHGHKPAAGEYVSV